MNLPGEVRSLVDGILPRVIEIRHAVHRNPEMALHEHETSALIRRSLQTTRIRLLAPLLGTDVVGMLEGKAPGKNVTLRADIDALPLHELTDVSYRSLRDGYMHACGHDGHTAMLVGAAWVLGQLADRFEGSVRFVFQPGEEVEAAGRNLVAAGALRDPEPDMVFALHAWADLPVGVLASKPGPFLASADFFRITVRGKGGHGAMPEQSVDPILTGARLVEALQAVISRQVSPLDAGVVSVCRFAAGSNSNIIPDEAVLEGTVRYCDAAVGKRIVASMERMVKGVCESLGASYEWSYECPYAPTINHESAVELGKGVVREFLGPECWQDLAKPSMGGEDFAYYIQKYPGAMFRLGMGTNSAPLHNPRFNFNDKALKHGVLFLVLSALRALGSLDSGSNSASRGSGSA